MVGAGARPPHPTWPCPPCGRWSCYPPAPCRRWRRATPRWTAPAGTAGGWAAAARPRSSSRLTPLPSPPTARLAAPCWPWTSPHPAAPPQAPPGAWPCWTRPRRAVRRSSWARRSRPRPRRLEAGPAARPRSPAGSGLASSRAAPPWCGRARPRVDLRPPTTRGAACPCWRRGKSWLAPAGAPSRGPAPGRAPWAAPRTPWRPPSRPRRRRPGGAGGLRRAVVAACPAPTRRPSPPSRPRRAAAAAGAGPHRQRRACGRSRSTPRSALPPSSPPCRLPPPLPPPPRGPPCPRPTQMRRRPACAFPSSACRPGWAARGPRPPRRSTCRWTGGRPRPPLPPPPPPRPRPRPPP